LKELLTPGVVAMFGQPVMQVVSVMRSGQGNLEKFHLVLSDGVHTQNATLASHLNRLVKNSHLRMGTIVRLLEFICNSVQNPR
jgi:replication factor A1